jgi:glycerol-3-phosphate dehydrogenase
MRIERDLARLSDPYDVAVVGGGITGVNVAREAAGRGLRVLLVDKGDLGAGTSSATTKYLHGGIRYLEQYQFGVVRESLRERRIVGLAAPHLVAPTRFLMPAWRWSKPGAALIGAGMVTYNALAYDRNRDTPESLRIPSPRWLSKRTLLRAVPWLDPDELQGAWGYHDTLNIHPERLLLAFVKSATAAGAVVLNHMAATGFLTRPGDDGVVVEGVELADQLTGQTYRVHSRAVVNAGGPWLDLVLRRLDRPLGVSVTRSKGVHVLTRPLGGKDAVFARTRSGRHVIVSPWMGRSFIGPTDTAISEEPDAVVADRSDVDLILDTINTALAPAVPPLTLDDVEATTVGIRPLVVDEGEDSYTASRRHEIYDHGTAGVANLWTIAGGKWTTGRAMGEEMVELLLRAPALEGLEPRRFDSSTAAVAGAFAWAEDAEPYLEQAARTRPELGLPADVRLHLARLYGTEHERVLDLVVHQPELGERVSQRPGRLDIAAQAVFAVTDETARTLSDIIDRRMVLGTLGRVTAEEVARVAAVVAPLLGWADAEQAAAVEREVERRRWLESQWRTPV